MTNRAQRNWNSWWSEYRSIKEELQTECHLIIMERDEGICQACGRRGTDLAHITTVQSFAKFGGTFKQSESLRDKMDAAYRDDNMVILCRECHTAQHTIKIYGHWSNDMTPKLKERKRIVNKLFRIIKKSRGWNGVSQLYTEETYDVDWKEVKLLMNKNAIKKENEEGK
jgi:5-methylcytosine-specific restriction endonuclease McrA